MGQVTPAPTLSRSSTVNRQPHSSHNTPQVSPAHLNPAKQNPTVLALQARSRLTKLANQEFDRLGRSDAGGREFLDVQTIRQALSSRDQYKLEAGLIEKRLGLKQGVVATLGGDRGGGGSGNRVYGNV